MKAQLLDRHTEINALLPLYVVNNLEEAQRQIVASHLADCAECQADLAFWETIGSEIGIRNQHLKASPGILEAAIERLNQQSKRPSRLQLAVSLLRSQIPLIHRELWLVSAMVFALGFIVAFYSRQAVIIHILAPMIAAACITMIYGPENDSAIELALSTPTSPQQILLARLALVFGYNMILALIASLGLLFTLPAIPLTQVILSWLGPMAFLSASALLLSLSIGPGNAILIAYLIWIAKFLPGSLLASLASNPFTARAVLPLLDAYLMFWQTPAVLLGLSALLTGISLYFVIQQEKSLPRWA